MKPLILVQFAPNVADEVERLLEERCARTRGAMSDLAARQALLDVQRGKRQGIVWEED